MLTVRIENLEEVKAILRKYPEKSRGAFNDAIKKSVIAVEGQSKRLVPRDTSRLGDSIDSSFSNLRGVVGTNVKYAVAVHENPRAGRTGGVSPRGKRYKRWASVGEYKYMEKAVKQLGDTIIGYFVTAQKEIFK